MKRCVCITLDVDPTEYHEAVDTREGAVDLVKAMLAREADLPDKFRIACEGHTVVVNHLGDDVEED